MDERSRRAEAQTYATSLDYTLKELQRKVREHENELEQASLSFSLFFAFSFGFSFISAFSACDEFPDLHSRSRYGPPQARNNCRSLLQGKLG